MVAVEEAGKVTPVQEVPCLPSPAQDSESGYSSYAGSYGTRVIFFIKIFIATKNILSGGGSYAGSESSYPGLGQQQPPLQPQQPLYSASVSPGQLSRSAR